MDLRSKIRLLAVTFVLAAVISYLLMIVIPYYLFLLLFVILWPALYFYWPQVSRWLGFVKVSKASAPRTLALKRPFWQRLVRGTLKSVGGIVLALVFISTLAAVPIGLCLNRAKNAHNAIHIGMTVPEVLHAVTDYDIFGASSEFPHDDKADAENVPALNLGKGKDGIYQMYDLSLSRNVRFSESEAIERLRAKLHDGHQWKFSYTYINMTPMHVSFSVVFGPDGRVTEVKPVYGWE